MTDIIVDDGVDMARMPDAVRTRAASAAAFQLVGGAGEPDCCIRFAADSEVQALNRDWRAKDKVTDVLSFPMQDGEIDMSGYLGDIALAVPFVVQEATRLGLAPADHALHLIVHGVLHLMGYDHEGNSDAARMQALERRALAQLGLHDPYPESHEERTHVG